MPSSTLRLACALTSTLAASSQRARDTAVSTYQQQPAAVIGGAAAVAGALVLWLVWRSRR